MLLAIDTATKLLGLALYDGESLLAEQFWRTNNKHNLILATSIEQILDICDVNTDDLTVIAVANGPGSYTGLRIGVALAKGMASARQLPLIGINTLDIIAAGQTFTDARHVLLCVLQAGRGRVIVGEYHVKKGRWQAKSTPFITKWGDLFADLETEIPYFVAGEVDAEGRKAIEATQQTELTVNLIDAAKRSRRTGFLAQLAWQRYHAGQEDDFAAAKLAPVYLNTLS